MIWTTARVDDGDAEPVVDVPDDHVPQGVVLPTPDMPKLEMCRRSPTLRRTRRERIQAAPVVVYAPGGRSRADRTFRGSPSAFAADGKRASPDILGSKRSRERLRPLKDEKEMGEQPNPKPDVVVPVVRVVVVAIRARSPVAIVVPRTAAHYLTGSPTVEPAAIRDYRSSPPIATLSFEIVCADAPVCRSQPPSKRPISSIIRLTCSY